MIMDLITYLLKNVASFEVEGIKAKGEDAMDKFFARLDAEKERMIRPVMDEFFAGLEIQKEVALRQFTKLSVMVTGFFLTAVGVAFVIDKLVGFDGVGFITVGILVLIGAILMPAPPRIMLPTMA